jgi:hypothetical protein
MLTPRAGTLLAMLASIALLAVPGTPASAVSASGTDTRTVPSHVFAATSPFYQSLPDGTAAATNSTALVSSLNSQAHDFYGTAEIANVAINTTSYTPALYVARNSDPAYDITAWNCQSHTASVASYLNDQLRGVHVPDDLRPDPSSDGSVSIYNPDSDEVIELWRARKVDGQWQACWGGRIQNAGNSLGRFDLTYGASASGMAMWATTIRQQELIEGHIDHVIGLGIPYTKKGSVSWPAVRTDGWKDGTQLSIGQMLRLPASLDLDSLKLSPVARTIAKAAQDYGIIVTDTSGSVAFTAENPIALASDQYSTIFRGRWAFQEMAGNPSKGEVAFPLDKLVALPVNYKVPTSTSTASEPSNGSTGSAPTLPAPGTNTAYAKAVKSAKPWLYWRLDDKTSTAADASGHKRKGTLRGVVRRVTGAIGGNRAITTKGNSSSSAYQRARTKPSKSFSIQVWFKTTTASGGKLAGFESTKTGSGARHDRSLYLTDGGRLVFGTYAGAIRTVASTAAYNDGRWHLATATQGSKGTRLYVDGTLVASSSVTAAQATSGYWRLGGGNLKNWPSAPSSSYLAGSLDEFAIYTSALSATTVRAQYRAAW